MAGRCGARRLTGHAAGCTSLRVAVRRGASLRCDRQGEAAEGPHGAASALSATGVTGPRRYYRTVGNFVLITPRVAWSRGSRNRAGNPRGTGLLILPPFPLLQAEIGLMKNTGGKLKNFFGFLGNSQPASKPPQQDTPTCSCRKSSPRSRLHLMLKG